MGRSSSRSNPKTSAAAAPSMRRVSSTGTSWKVFLSHSRDRGQVPSGCGKSFPQSMLSTPIS
jgi:hypothetical protein